jgi:hypothetical protein
MALVISDMSISLFGTLDASITLERTQAQATPAATHIAFRVVR